MTCSRGVKIKADCKIAECEARQWDAVVCPGGMPGAVNLKENETLEGILKKQVWGRRDGYTFLLLFLKSFHLVPQAKPSLQHGIDDSRHLLRCVSGVIASMMLTSVQGEW